MSTKIAKSVFISLFVIFGLDCVESYPGEIIYGCVPAEKEWEGEYTPWSGHTKNAHAHLTFDDGPFVNITDTILDVLKEYNTPATFFLVAENLNEDTRYLVDRMINEGHMIGSHSMTHANLQYGNTTILQNEIEISSKKFREYLGYQPKLFRPPFGSIDHRSHALLEELGYTIVQWSAGCVDWWFTDNEKDLETSIAAMRFGLAEAGGIVCMHDKAEAPNNGERLRKFLDDTWNFWEYVDFNTCINRDDVDEGVVFKNYNEYKEAVADEVKKSGGLDVLTGALEERVGEVYLTFDDGPIDATEGVLNVLRETGTKATFFINAFHLFGEGDENEDNALKFLKQTVKDGHIIANHSYDHMLNNCCRGENKDECGAIVCNEIAMWNVKAYQNLEDETENFHFNTKIVHQVLKHDRNGEIPANDHMGDMARLPYTNSWRIPGMDSDCACCTTDDVPPWDENFICSLEDPTFSATLSGIVASELYKSGLSVYGWDIEWGPEDWGAADPAASLTSAEDLAKSVMEVAEGNKCEMQAEKANIALCSVTHHQGKVVILTHDFLFEDGGRGMGATTNLPKLRKFIEIMKENGYIFKTVDQYHDDTVAAGVDAGIGGKSGKQNYLLGKSGKFGKSNRF